ncbi:TetR/AcrR family transcriptional regulator [Amycolatopsis carbonis]|uniref:TetR/AcrR family transcriptional regulator n=1 Tax=Amycolatopsis carbonis TaxID=715471 RepID=A0A9Y2MYC5_9PSEU|nr:TetR/AcrR family transcriptional regulator [Amycolatopsis sp. 2-15]WIX79929.1 TetR/AcrR family transcriptional regulator [Amycolatopsis sp. 2-15]
MSPRGRPRAFDREHALTQAMFVFWERGYEGTSLADLTGAMGINPPSLYAAFGGKEALFREAVERYGETYGSHTPRALREESTARAAIEAMLRDNARSYVDPAHPSGCMVVLAATNCSPANGGVCAHLRAQREEVRDLVRARLRRGVKEGDLAESVDIEALGAYYATILFGLSMQARDGVDLAGLTAIIDAAMLCWPGTDRENVAGAASEVDTAPVASS